MKSETMTKVVEHGQKLNAIFHTDLDPVVLCKKLRRIENKLSNYSVQYCNGEIDSDKFDAICEQYESKLDCILNYRAQKIPVFINSDPRGYALKIRDGYKPIFTNRLPTDWGGYGLIAPDLN